MATASTQIIPHTDVEHLREAKRIIEHEAAALQAVSQQLDAGFCSAVELIAGCRGSVVVTGVGKAGLVGQKMTATFSSTGTRSHFLHPTEAVHGDLGCLHADDVVLVLSNSGETEEVCRLLPVLKRMNIPIIALTATKLSTLGRAAEAVISIGRLREAGLQGLPPSTSTTAMMAVGDAMALVVSRIRGFTSQEFAFFHPAGSLGRKLTPVTEIMRSGNELRIAREQENVRKVFRHNPNHARRTGAVMIIDDQGQLSGLFTDSDLARILESHREELLDHPVKEVMTVRPLTISDSALLGEAVDLLAERKLSELPVVNKAGVPVGLIDITDIITLMPQSLAMNTQN